jgi:hypothetical protein
VKYHKKIIISLVVAACVIFELTANISAVKADSVTPIMSTAGDVDGDGCISINDATALQFELAEISNPAVMYVNQYNAIELNLIPYLESEEVDPSSYMLLDSSELSLDLLTNRAEHNLEIVERVIAQVHGNRGDILNARPSDRDNFISCKYLPFSVQDGTIILSYLLYDPNNDSESDVIARFDYVLDRRYEKDKSITPKFTSQYSDMSATFGNARSCPLGKEQPDDWM